MADTPPIVIPDPFTTDKLKQDVDQLDKLPANSANIGLEAENGHVGVEGSVSKSIGTHGEVEAQGSWLTQVGWRVAAMFGWKW